jgi:hypothetical protein
MVTTPMGPEFVKNTGQSGAKSGDHTHLTARYGKCSLEDNTLLVILGRVA